MTAGLQRLQHLLTRSGTTGRSTNMDDVDPLSSVPQDLLRRLGLMPPMWSGALWLRERAILFPIALRAALLTPPDAGPVAISVRVFDALRARVEAEEDEAARRELEELIKRLNGRHEDVGELGRQLRGLVALARALTTVAAMADALEEEPAQAR